MIGDIEEKRARKINVKEKEREKEKNEIWAETEGKQAIRIFKQMRWKGNWKSDDKCRMVERRARIKERRKRKKQ